MMRKWTEDGGGGEKREKQARMVAEFQREGYHIGTVSVKEYLEVIEKMEDRGRERLGVGKNSHPHPWKSQGMRHPAPSE